MLQVLNFHQIKDQGIIFYNIVFFFQFKINIILIIESPVDEVTVNPKWAQCGIGKISTQFDRKL